MSVLKSLQEYIKAYPGIESVQTDIPQQAPGNYALAPAESKRLGEDTAGNKLYEHKYAFYARESIENEAAREKNYRFLEGFCDWIERQDSGGLFPDLGGQGQIEGMEASGILLKESYEDGTGLYTVQLKITLLKRNGDE